MPDTIIPRRATYDDYCRFPDDGKRYEILDGEIFMTPAPSPRHQYTSKRLQRILEGISRPAGAPGLQCAARPDPRARGRRAATCSVVERTQISGRGIEGPPLVLVEILSPSRPEYDRVTKARRYAARGVRHYWIVTRTHAPSNASSSKAVRTGSTARRPVTMR